MFSESEDEGSSGEEYRAHTGDEQSSSAEEVELVPRRRSARLENQN